MMQLLLQVSYSLALTQASHRLSSMERECMGLFIHNENLFRTGHLFWWILKMLSFLVVTVCEMRDETELTSNFLIKMKSKIKAKQKRHKATTTTQQLNTLLCRNVLLLQFSFYLVFFFLIWENQWFRGWIG